MPNERTWITEFHEVVNVLTNTTQDVEDVRAAMQAVGLTKPYGELSHVCTDLLWIKTKLAQLIHAKLNSDLADARASTAGILTALLDKTGE